MRSKTLFRDDDRTVVKLNPNWMEGLYHTAKTNQTLLFNQYAARLIEELVERVEALEAQLGTSEPVEAASVDDPSPSKSGATTIVDEEVVAAKPARRTAKKAAEPAAE